MIGRLSDSRQEGSSFGRYHGPTRGFDKIIFIPVDPPPDLTIVPIAIGACFGVLLLLRIAEFIRKRHDAVVQREAVLDALRKQVDDSLQTTGTLAFGMVVVNAYDFVQHGKFVPYETLRDLNQLKARPSLTQPLDANSFPLCLMADLSALRLIVSPLCLGC